MSKAASLPRSRRVAKAGAKGTLPDRIAGGLAMALDAVLLLMHGMSVRGAHAAHLVATREAMVGLGTLAVAFVAHAGVFRGTRWGFVVTAALAAWGLVTMGGPAGVPVVLSTNLWLLLYAAFRLGSAYGPKAR